MPDRTIVTKILCSCGRVHAYAPRLGLGSWAARDFLRLFDVTSFGDVEWLLGTVDPYADGYVVVGEQPIDPRLARARGRR